jgi:type VI secretion system protein ImpM
VDAALMESRRVLGEGWVPAWMQAPIWRFALPGGACGPEAVLGLTLPSVDRAGRHYPLTVAAVFGSGAPGDEGWLDAVEALALDALAQDRSPEVLMDALAGVAAPGLEPGVAGWWTTGSPLVPAVRMDVAGLPDPGLFAGMIDAGGAA